MNKKFSIDPIDDKPAAAGKHDFIQDSRTAGAKPGPDGVIISPVVYQVDPDKLTPNPLNSLFKEESAEYFETLTADIKERGFKVPLIAKRNGELLAGHNRRKIALALGLPRVPVQYVESELSPDQERAFVIKDNLFRRQLTQEDRLNLYKILFPDFDEKIKEETRGGDRKSDGSNRKESGLIGGESDALTAANLAKKAKAAGVNVSQATVEKDMAKARAQAKGEAQKPKEKRPADAGQDQLKTVKAHLAKIVKTLDGANKRTRDAAIIEIIETLDRIGIDSRYSNQVKQIKKNMKG